MRVERIPLDRAPRTESGQFGNHIRDESAGASLRDSVRRAVRAYLDGLDGHLGSEVYRMVLAEVEAPLLEEIMRYTESNQTRASLMLGLNRGTLRKKLKLYGLLDDGA